MSARAVHWIGGVEFESRGGITIMLKGYPVCCSGPRCMKLVSGPSRLTTVPQCVTCKGCLRRMRKDERAKAWGVLEEQAR
jgi:hypothetical protein